MSNSQKFENLLNLSLDSTEAEREKSVNLETGYSSRDDLWELIIKYSGDFSLIAEIAVSYSLLLNEFAIIVIPEDHLSLLASLPNVEYVEKPKALFFALESARRAACVTPLQLERNGLFGNGVLIAMIDSGIDIFNYDFRNPDGSTRLLYLWDQSVEGNPPDRYFLGTEYDSAQINAYLNTPPAERRSPIPGEDISGHGTSVMGIAAGNGAGSMGRYTGVAPEASLLAVKLAPQNNEAFPRTTQLMQGVDYAVRKGLELRLPVVVNLSFGNNYGPHDNSFLLEQFLDDISNYWKSVIVVGSGNEGDARSHTSLQITEGESETVRLSVGNFEPSLSVQLWKNYIDKIDVTIISPSGRRYVVPMQIPDAHRTVMDNTLLLIYVGEPSPFSSSQELYIEFLPEETYIAPGEWRFEITGTRIIIGEINMWLPGKSIIGASTAFSEPNADLTLTVPSTAQKVITVGAYDSRTNSYAPFSGRGSEALGKPDLVAPGVDIIAPAVNNSYAAVSGTSIATPFVSGAAALLMEWGIVRGNDPYLYGEKVKAYLKSGARQLLPESYPNPRLGFGALCVQNSFPYSNA